MNTDEKIKAIADVVTQAVKDSGGKFGDETFTINEDGSVRENWFIKGHIAPVLLAHGTDLASDKDE